MKKALIFAAVLAFAACSGGGKMTVTVQNPSGFDRAADMVEIPVEDISQKVEVKTGQVLLVKNSAGKIIPSQYTFDGKLIFQSGLAAGESSSFTISAGDPQVYGNKTHAAFLPERMDDFLWENDRVGFRIYGPALVAKDGPSNGIDALYKRTDKIVIRQWIERDLAGNGSYHDDHGEGMDDYKVGRSLGAGAMAPFVNDTLWLNENYSTWEILENGPLRSTFKLVYKDLNVSGKTVSESRTFSIDAGSQLTKITQEYGFAETTQVAAGIVKRESGDSVIYGRDYIIYAEPATQKSNGVYLGLLFPKGFNHTVIQGYEVPAGEKGAGPYKHVLAVDLYEPGAPVTYYTGYGWSQFGFPAVSDFQAYMDRFSAALSEPFAVTYEQ